VGYASGREEEEGQEEVDGVDEVVAGSCVRNVLLILCSSAVVVLEFATLKICFAFRNPHV
jgi:hypothetical protein